MQGRGDRRESVEPISMVRVAGGWREGKGAAREWRGGYRKGDNDHMVTVRESAGDYDGDDGD